MKKSILFLASFAGIVGVSVFLVLTHKSQPVQKQTVTQNKPGHPSIMPQTAPPVEVQPAAQSVENEEPPPPHPHNITSGPLPPDMVYWNKRYNEDDQRPYPKNYKPPTQEELADWKKKAEATCEQPDKARGVMLDAVLVGRALLPAIEYHRLFDEVAPLYSRTSAGKVVLSPEEMKRYDTRLTCAAVSLAYAQSYPNGKVNAAIAANLLCIGRATTQITPSCEITKDLGWLLRARLEPDKLRKDMGQDELRTDMPPVNDAEMWFALGTLAHGDGDRTMHCFRRALKLKPDLAEVYWWVSTPDNPAAAYTMLDKAEKINPKLKTFFLGDRASIAIGAKDHDSYFRYQKQYLEWEYAPLRQVHLDELAWQMKYREQWEAPKK